MVSSHYKERKVYISISQRKKLKAALKANKSILTLKVQQPAAAATANGVDGENALLLLTKRQITKLEKSKRGYATVNMSRRQVRANKTFKGGFLSMLAGLAAKALPYILSGLASGVPSGVV